MPTYDYECDACGHEFEHFQRITEDPLKKCPECKKSKLRRLFGTGAAVVFKGSGFYETDYRSESYKKGAESDKKATTEKKSDSASGDSGSKKTDSSGGSSTAGGSEKSSSSSSKGSGKDKS